MSGEHIPFGINSSGDLVDVTEVARGNSCGAICPGCHAPLSARQGTKVSWYFAHVAGTECNSGYESALHLAVKQLINESKSLLLPACVVVARQVINPDEPLSDVSYDYRARDQREGFKPEEFDLRFPGEGIGRTEQKQVNFERVELEQWAEDIRPDIVASLGDRQLFIEVAVTHFVDGEKLGKIKRRGVSTIELDLAQHHRTQWTWTKLREILFSSTLEKNWLFNGLVETRAEHDLRARVARVAPILAAKDKANALEKFARDTERELALKKLASRRKYYEQNFEATYDIKIRWSSGLTHHLELSPRNTRITAWYTTPHKQPSLCEFVAMQFRGKYNARFKQWEFPSSVELFYKIAEFILKKSRGAITYFKCPPETTMEDIPEIVRKNIPRG
jgi:Competence protein CoiA-like family